MILLQRYAESGKIGKEEMAVLNHAILNGLPYRFINETDLSLAPPHSLFVGSVEGVRQILELSGKTLPEPDYYPKVLGKYMSRQVWDGTPHAVMIEVAQGHSVFAKPKNEWKSFTGQVFDRHDGMGLIASLDDDMELWVSEVIDIDSEFRVYVQSGEVVATCQYTGEEDRTPDMSMIQQAVSDLKTSGFRTDTYAFDWGLTKDGNTVFIEMNDAFAIGRYKGISDKEYYEFLQSRWNQLVD